MGSVGRDMIGRKCGRSQRRVGILDEDESRRRGEGEGGEYAGDARGRGRLVHRRKRQLSGGGG